MAVKAVIQKRLGAFQLEMSFESTGGCIGILGASGCGKCMTLKCLAGIEKPDTGRIELNGRVLFDSEEGINLPPQQRRVGYLFQNYALFPVMTVEENIGAGLWNKKNKAVLVPDGATKKNGALKLKELFGCDKIVAFGDGVNDIPLFKAADECYAVSNAASELKEIATAVIVSNEEDSVATWLHENAE